MVNVVSKLSGLKQHNFLERRVLIRSCDIIQGGENGKLGGLRGGRKSLQAFILCRENRNFSVVYCWAVNLFYKTSTEFLKEEISLQN